MTEYLQIKSVVKDCLDYDIFLLLILDYQPTELTYLLFKRTIGINIVQPAVAQAFP